MMPSKPDKPKINPRQMVRDGRQDELYQLICATGYIPDEGNFSDFCQSVLSGFALLACGNPGSGKTVFTDALYEACNLDYYTVTGRDELRQEELLCSWDRREQEAFMQEVRQLVETRPEAERARALESARKQRWNGRFLILGEVAAAYAKAQESEFPTLLRLDEADKFGAAIEDALLSPLATGKIYVERLSEGFVGCANPDFLPIVISTSNDSRHELSLPFRDRHLHTYFATPSLGKELEILLARCPEIGAANLSQALKLLDAIRSVAGLSHYPSVRTAIQLARAFERDSITEITERNVSVYFTYFAKNWRDADYLKKQLPYLLSCVGTFHLEIDDWLAERDTEWAKYWGRQRGLVDVFREEQIVEAAPESPLFGETGDVFQNDFSFNQAAM
ncbi:MAG: AAA family ATPase [Acidobacteriota bacterium]|nr:AAA family ATPase [Acidobacteriota bacterium]